MPCTYPLTAYRLQGQTALGFNPHDPRVVSQLSVPCSQCIMCRLGRACGNGIRCMHEASMYGPGGTDNMFLTLTYEDGKLPPFGTLVPRDVQLFIKRLRKAIYPAQCRFYGCGEYGEKLARPHYHLLIFGYRFADMSYWKKSGCGEKLYVSAQLRKLWPFGDHYIGAVTFASAAYVARYCLDVVNGDEGKEYYRIIDPATGRDVIDSETGEIMRYCPQFSRMSLKPGIGASWLAKYRQQTFAHDYIIIDGRKMPVPKYYDEILSRSDPEKLECLKLDRAIRAEASAAERTSERRIVHEAVKVASMNQKQHSRF